MAAKSSRKVIKKAAKKAVKGPAKKPAKNTAKRAAVKAVRKGSGTGLLATGGGSAPAAGVTFQGWVGGLFAATGLTQASVDKRFQLKAESIAEFRLETESPIDDLIVYTTAPGRLFVQAKTNLSMAQSDSDAMMKTLDQIVRQWRLCTEGKKTRRWDYVAVCTPEISLASKAAATRVRGIPQQTNGAGCRDRRIDFANVEIPAATMPGTDLGRPCRAMLKMWVEMDLQTGTGCSPITRCRLVEGHRVRI